MSYDLMNRRDTKTNHHTSATGAAETIERYLKIGAPGNKINLGFAFYAKYFTTAGDCSKTPIGCPIVLAEDPVTGADTLTSGAWTFEKQHMQPIEASRLVPSTDGTCGADKMTKCTSGCCSQYGNCGFSREHCSGACQHAFGTGCTDPDIFGSWQIASANGLTDQAAGGQYYFDKTNNLFWTWDTLPLITRKFDEIVKTYGLGGVMAWSLGEDSFDWSHIGRIASRLNAAGYGQYDVVLNSDDAGMAEDKTVESENTVKAGNTVEDGNIVEGENTVEGENSIEGENTQDNSDWSEDGDGWYYEEYKRKRV
jgi:chitinase